MTSARRAAEQTDRDTADITWFQRTGHCGGCGQPAAFCLCTERRPCGCRALHPMGTGIDADPADVFAVTVDDSQGELFA